MSDPTPEQIAAFKPLLDEWMAEFMKLPADVQEKYNKSEADWAATGKPMTEAPDHLKGIELHAACDKNGDGMLNEEEWHDFSLKMDEYNLAKYGGIVPMPKEVHSKWWNVMKVYSPGDGITLADMEHSNKLYAACFAE